MVAVAAVVMPVIVVPAATPAPTSSSPTSIVPWLRLLTVRVVASIVPLKMATGSLWALLRSAWGMLRSRSRIGLLVLPRPVASTPRPCTFCTAEAVDLVRAPAMAVLRPVLEAKVSVLTLAEPMLMALLPLCSEPRGRNRAG